jgi:alanyl-tRNA synthetase
MNWHHRKIRRTFLDFFVDHPELAHREVPSSPIIPPDDPTLLFTNAGMNQFKSLLLGQEKRDYTRACSVQKVMRVGGKHNDLDAVGKDGRHLTWFEMLGNWSFGDYYKLDAIKMAWNLTANVFQLDLDRVYASVYKDDDESYAIWRDEIGLEEKKIYRFGDIEKGDDENFWSMGPVGPCGPCTELFYDLGPEAGNGPDDVMGGEGDRFSEFWNNVFMEHNRDASGKLTPLSIQSVDTGMGMERITTILQGKTTVYETDLFTPLLAAIESASGRRWTEQARRIDLQVIADHIRSLTFVLSEGGQFSNEGRGYVLRRILRRAVRHGRRLGFEGPFLHALVPAVAEVFDGIYDLPDAVIGNTSEALEQEEHRFFRTIDRGMSRISTLVKKRADAPKVITGKEAFELYDTYGFPVDLTAIEAEDHGFTVDVDAFNTHMEAQRARSRESAKFHDMDDSAWVNFSQSGGQSFAGYGLESHETTVVRYKYVDDVIELVLESTPFYAEGGGELGDHGEIVGDGFKVAITDVQRLNGVIHHMGTLAEGTLNLTETSKVVAHVDLARRSDKTVHHTATHLLHAALQNVLGANVQQKGSVVATNRLRFDFSHGKPMTTKEVAAVEHWVNAEIRANRDVQIQEGVSLDDAKAQGVTALFGEKYGESVRTVRSGPHSFELCGGNHVSGTGAIGYFMILSETGVAAGVRRIEAVAGAAAEDAVNQQRSLLNQAATALKTEQPRVPERIGVLQANLKSLRKDLERAQSSGGGIDLDALMSKPMLIGGVALIVAKVEAPNRGLLAKLMDKARDKAPQAAILFLSVIDDGVVVIGGLGSSLKKSSDLHIGRFVGQICAELDGRGGGRPDFAQGGGKNTAKIDAVVKQIPVWFETISA